VWLKLVEFLASKQKMLALSSNPSTTKKKKKRKKNPVPYLCSIYMLALPPVFLISITGHRFLRLEMLTLIFKALTLHPTRQVLLILPQRSLEVVLS
jgi:hypothetical protein